ncbi:Hypothetical protein D9617_1g079410 [Elsinoe fawcettii]|nr:Hypothetical protein D9617_1g079410 [Elsinoe fawcettii]
MLQYMIALPAEQSSGMPSSRFCQQNRAKAREAAGEPKPSPPPPVKRPAGYISRKKRKRLRAQGIRYDWSGILPQEQQAQQQQQHEQTAPDEARDDEAMEMAEDSGVSPDDEGFALPDRTIKTEQATPTER